MTENIEHLKRVIVTLRPFALARARDIERRDLFFAHKFSDDLRSILCGNFRGIDQLDEGVLCSMQKRTVCSVPPRNLSK